MNNGALKKVKQDQGEANLQRVRENLTRGYKEKMRNVVDILLKDFHRHIFNELCSIIGCIAN